uniref:Prostate transmembrane protein, androgen induced 1 n=1 Tax=Canis lupus familiaris TaxID=9615 RepID=A0A8C0T151_CANLF
MVVVMVMVVVITCLLSHYKLSARSFIGRHSQGRRREDALSSEGCLWPSESTVSGSGIPEVSPPVRPQSPACCPPPPAPRGAVVDASGHLPGKSPLQAGGTSPGRRSVAARLTSVPFSEELSLAAGTARASRSPSPTPQWGAHRVHRLEDKSCPSSNSVMRIPSRAPQCTPPSPPTPREQRVPPRQPDPTASAASGWRTLTLLCPPQPQVYAPPRPTDRLAVPPFTQRDRFHRFQPTYPYLQHQIDLPPTISLSDGRSPRPTRAPAPSSCRDPEQQLELNRESVRAPPEQNHLRQRPDGQCHVGRPLPPSSNSGISATCYGGGGRMEGPPPTYSEVIGHYPGSPAFQHQQSSGPPSLLEGTRLPHAHIAPWRAQLPGAKKRINRKGHPL